MATIDLNADVGESYGPYTIGEDAQLIPLITSANIACGLHAGDYKTIAKTVQCCVENDVQIGAHIGFHDIYGFGRRNLPVDAQELSALTIYQVGVMLGFCRSRGVKLNHVKLHGALYNLVAESQTLSRALIGAIRSIDDSIVLYGLSGSANERAAKELNHPFCAEVFSDRAYLSNGCLVPRTDSRAMIHDSERANQRMVELIQTGKINAVDGTPMSLRVETICIHGDKPGAAKFALELRNALEANNIQIKGFCLEA